MATRAGAKAAAGISSPAAPISHDDVELDVKSFDARRGLAAYEALSRCARQTMATVY